MSEGLFLSLVGAAMLALFVWAASAEHDERLAFMEQCMEERKQYECKAMWRAGDANITPIIIPVR